MALDRSYFEEWDESIEKQALDWNPHGGRSRVKPTKNLEKDRFRGSRKMKQNME
jgi:hypothetical protein